MEGIRGSRIPDVQDQPSPIPIPLQWTGVSRVRRLLRLGDRVYDAVISMHISLPGSKRGAHMSRLIGCLEELSRGVFRGGLLDFARELAVRILGTHPQACSSRAIVEATHYHGGSYPVYVRAGYEARRGGGGASLLSIEAEGVTACPCAQAVYSAITGASCSPAPTHMQRARARLSIRCPGAPGLPGVDELAEAVLDGFSGRLGSLVDRVAEYKLVRSVLENPVFAEDAARRILMRALELLGGMEDALVSVYVESYDSIHHHNITVEASYTIGELRRVLGARAR